MRTLPIAIFAIFLIQAVSFSQPRSSCLPEGIIFVRQSQVDSFAISYPGCTDIGGNVTIQGQDISDLSALSALASIGGDLSLYEMSLSGFSGLYNLAEIHGDLSIRDNVNLTSLSGLASLTAIDGNLFITGNTSLTDGSCPGICNYLSAPPGSVNIYNNGTGCNNPPAVAAVCGIGLPCLPYGNYYMLTQSDIDDFMINYPGCHDLQGNLTVMGDGISNLTGLSGITSVGGDLKIVSDSSIINLSGLDAVVSVGGDLSIGEHWDGNAALVSLEGLVSLASVGGSLNIVENTALQSLGALNGLTSLGGGLTVSGNTALQNLSGLEGLGSIGGNLIIGDNPGLASLDGLENTGSVAGQVQVFWNSSLTSITGLQNIDASSVTGLTIRDNPELAECNVESVCNYLSGAGGLTEIFGNAQGCRNPFQVANACGQTFPCLPGNYYFFSQADIDDFQSFAGCVTIEGNVVIRGNDIVSLEGLSSITQVLGGLEISDCPQLESLAGLDNLTSVGGSLSIHNDSALIHLTGLNNLVSAGELSVVGNPLLASLDGLEQLTSVSGGIRIGSYNSALTSIEGIRNVEAGSVAYLTIIDNQNLSACDVESVCAILSSPNGTVTIYGNGSGCESLEAVEAECGVGVEESAVGSRQSAVSVYPNPTVANIDFRISNFDGRWVSLKVYNVQGSEVATLLDGTTPAGEQTVTWDASRLPAGFYFYRLTVYGDSRLRGNGRQPVTGKIIKF